MPRLLTVEIATFMAGIARADTGELPGFPGVSAPWEAPVKADLVLPTHEWPVGKCVEAIAKLLEDRGAI